MLPLPICPLAGQSVWGQNTCCGSIWAQIVPFFAFPDEIRRVIYTTNAIESLNYSLRKVSKHRSLFPSDEALFKLLYLALQNISRRWARAPAVCAGVRGPRAAALTTVNLPKPFTQNT